MNRKFNQGCLLLICNLAICGKLLAETSVNEDFENTTAREVIKFGKEIKDVAIDAAQAAPGCGKQSLVIEYEKPDGFSGISLSTVNLNQTEAKPILLEAWAKVEKPFKKEGSYTFGMSGDVEYMDGTRKWEGPALKLFFNSQTDKWQIVSCVWTPSKPVKTFRPKLMFNGVGKVWFDRVRVIDMAEVKAKNIIYGAPEELAH